MAFLEKHWDWSGLYVHVPFCAKVCSYCDFAVLKAPQRLQKEWLLRIQKDLMEAPPGYPPFRTLYLGGGTPSILQPKILAELRDSLEALLDFSKLKEFTLEANPEDITPANLDFWKSLGVNRISVGIQSFSDQMLNTIGRVHSAKQALKALEFLQNSGIQFSGDLMFQLPGQTEAHFLKNLDTLLQFNPKHISFYGLTIEENTLIEQKIRKQRLTIDERNYARMYLQGVQKLAEAGFQRYEISNFAKPGFEAVHNALYWELRPYLGLGPGAHSLLGGQRSAEPRKFRDWVLQKPKEVETLSETSLLFEKRWLGLRRASGVSKNLLSKEWIEKYQRLDWIEANESQVRLKGEGWLYLDEIILDLD